jgi:hypothetical protein
VSAATGSVTDLGGVRTRNTVVTRGISALAAVAIALAVGGSLLGGGRSGPLAWSGDARVFPHPSLPGDRVLTGTLRNDGDRVLRVDIGDVRVVGADGAPVPAAPVFLEAFGKPLWSPARGPVQVDDSELQRTGRIAALEPGEEVPLTIAWHAADGRPVRVEWGGGSVPIP